MSNILHLLVRFYIFFQISPVAVSLLISMFAHSIVVFISCADDVERSVRVTGMATGC